MSYPPATSDNRPTDLDPPPRKHSNGFSIDRYHNPSIPTYLPPEFYPLSDGRLLRAVERRAAYDDVRRVATAGGAAEFFAHAPTTPAYDAAGNRRDTPARRLADVQQKIFDDIAAMRRRHVERTQGAGDGNGRIGEITRKIWLTPEQMDGKAYGAIFGARGATHQAMERETRTKIVLAGKGITDMKKKINIDRGESVDEEPHIRITGADEKSVGAAMEKLEWILSDAPEAVEFRENNRAALAVSDGRFETIAEARMHISGMQQRTTGMKRDREEDTPLVKDILEVVGDV